MAGSSTKAVYAAIGGNSVVMLAKFGAFAMTGSGAMLSEGIHSFADVGNQVLLAVGIRQSQKIADEEHPYGYAREQFIWAMISAVGIFFLGCGVSIYHGVHSLLHPAPLEDMGVAVAVLVFSLLVEGATLLIAVRAVSAHARQINMTFTRYLVEGPDPMSVAVLLEDGAAVSGVLMALVSVGLFQLTGNPVFDAVASILIGLLLGAVALFLIYKNRENLLTPSVPQEDRDKLRAVLENDPVVERVSDVKATIIGADAARFKAEVEFDGRMVARRYMEGVDIEAIWNRINNKEDLYAYLVQYGDELVDAVGDEIDRLEGEIRHAMPSVHHVDLEAD
jgi:zinc transporter 9